MRLSMIFAWSTPNECWLSVTATGMPVDQMGRTLIRALSSSTCVIAHRLQGSIAKPSESKSFKEFLMMQALFRNLREVKHYECWFGPLYFSYFLK